MLDAYHESVKSIVPNISRGKRRKNIDELRIKGLAASYARFSTAMQNESSNEDQHRGTGMAAEKNGHTIHPEHRYSDQEISGTRPDREGLSQLLEDARSGKFSVIYFFSLSRLARQSLLSMTLLKRLVHVYGVRIISVSEGIDSDQPGWEMAAGIVSMFHERYLQQLAADVLRGQEGCVLGGYSVGDHRYGFKSVELKDAAPRGRGKKPPKEYQINHDEAIWVVAIFQWFVEKRYSISKIVKDLNKQSVPKGHRQQRSYWTHSNVISILQSPKYVGVWPWGLLQNHRDPETGKVWQEARDAADMSDNWIRYRKDLQLVDVELFQSAQRLMAINREVYAKDRNARGQFNSCRGSRGNPPRHLLSNLLFCRQCNHKFYIGGANSKYLFCPNNQRGTCDCRSRISRKLAVTRILEILGNLIASDEAWLAETTSAVLAAWKKNTATIPSEIATTERAIEEIDRKIENLLDRIENGIDEVTIARRIKQRRKERNDLSQRLNELRSSKTERAKPPTMEWVRDSLKNLCNLKSLSEPANIEAIHALLGGRVEVEEVRPESGKRFLRGFVRLRVSDTTRILLGRAANDFCVPEDDGPIFVIDFKESHPLAASSEVAKRHYDEGRMNAEIGKIMNKSRSMVTKLLKFWFESRGKEMPDGRSRRANLEKKHLERPYYQEISEKVQALLDQGLLIVDVATTIGCDINTVRTASQFWHKSHGLNYVDGRSRRKSLSRKSRTEQ